MAKNNNVLTAQQKLAAMMEEMKRLQSEVAEENKAHAEKINAKISDLPKFLGVETHEDAYRAIAAYRKGTLNGKVSEGTANRLTEAQVTEVKELLKKGVQVSVIASKFGVTAPSIYRYKKQVEAAAVAPVPAAPAEPAAAPAPAQ